MTGCAYTVEGLTRLVLFVTFVDELGTGGGTELTALLTGYAASPLWTTSRSADHLIYYYLILILSLNAL